MGNCLNYIPRIIANLYDNYSLMPVIFDSRHTGCNFKTIKSRKADRIRDGPARDNTTCPDKM